MFSLLSNCVDLDPCLQGQLAGSKPSLGPGHSNTPSLSTARNWTKLLCGLNFGMAQNLSIDPISDKDKVDLFLQWDGWRWDIGNEGLPFISTQGQSSDLASTMNDSYHSIGNGKPQPPLCGSPGMLSCDPVKEHDFHQQDYWFWCSISICFH